MGGGLDNCQQFMHAQILPRIQFGIETFQTQAL